MNDLMIVDNQIKPEVCGIGVLKSAQSWSDSLCNNNCNGHLGTEIMQGTSMATPSLTATAAILYQYLRDGHYHCIIDIE